MPRGGKSLLVLLLAVLLAMYLLRYTALRSPASVSAVETVGNMGVYWDSRCLGKVYSVDWGVLHLGETKETVVYVQNEGNESFYLSLTTASWSPSSASSSLRFSWNPRGIRIQANEVATITLDLHVSGSVYQTTSFVFNMIFAGSEYLFGDLNKDNAVDTKDYIILRHALPSSPGKPNWNPDADLNKDGVIDVRDFQIIRTLIPTLPQDAS